LQSSLKVPGAGGMPHNEGCDSCVSVQDTTGMWWFDMAG